MGYVLWITGLPCSGKTTLAKSLQKNLRSFDLNCLILDGDDIRSSISSDLDFSQKSRTENVRRVANISKMLNQQSIITIVSMLSPLNSQRKLASKIIQENFYLIYLSTSLKVCEERDTKKMYRKARENKIKDFTGINSKFEIPKNYDVIIDTNSHDEEKTTNIVMDFLNNNSLL